MWPWEGGDILENWVSGRGGLEVYGPTQLRCVSYKESMLAGVGCLIKCMSDIPKVTEGSHRTKSHQVWLLLNLSAFQTILKSGHQKSGMIACVVCKVLSQGVLSYPFKRF